MFVKYGDFRLNSFKLLIYHNNNDTMVVAQCFQLNNFSTVSLITIDFSILRPIQFKWQQNHVFLNWTILLRDYPVDSTVSYISRCFSIFGDFRLYSFKLLIYHSNNDTMVIAQCFHLNAFFTVSLMTLDYSILRSIQFEWHQNNVFLNWTF